jgi:hypothetical protein
MGLPAMTHLAKRPLSEQLCLLDLVNSGTSVPDREEQLRIGYQAARCDRFDPCGSRLTREWCRAGVPR